MYCPRCGLKQPEGAQVCPACNYEVGRLPVTELAVVEAEEKPAQPPVPQKSRTGRSVLLFCVLGALALVVALLAGLWQTFFPAKEQQDRELLLF